MNGEEGILKAVVEVDLRDGEGASQEVCLGVVIGLIPVKKKLY